MCGSGGCLGGGGGGRNCINASAAFIVLALAFANCSVKTVNRTTVKSLSFIINEFKLIRGNTLP
jgi:hypothetical protein